MPLRHLIILLGDQLDLDSAALEGFDPAQDAVWMAEVPAEATYAWSHKARLVVFLSAMRHFAEALRARGWTVHYQTTGEHAHADLGGALAADLARLKPQAVIAVEPGEWRLWQTLHDICAAAGVPYTQRADRHFLCALDDFAAWMRGRKQPRMEHFYRRMRQQTGWLMQGDTPEGGQWNFDHDNRDRFGRDGPGAVPPPLRFPPDALTRQVMAVVEQHYGDHPGQLDAFDWPVTRDEALEALDDFITTRLPRFGQYQDAMWSGEPWLYHARLSAALNLKLLHPREVCEAAVRAWREGEAPLAAVEGFVRQILGWREYVRGLYFHSMPGYLDDNALDANLPLPALYWTGDTDMRCLAETVGDTLAHGYAHHIQRLMVTGLFALLLGVRPREVHQWYLAVYVDAVEWVELPNTLGMSQFADGGFMASKPYVASGKYIDRMSNYCQGCRFDPAQRTGPRACPFTTLYWGFLDQHEKMLSANPRTGLMAKNIARLDDTQRTALRQKVADTFKNIEQL